MARGRADWTALRRALFGLLDADAPGADETQDRVAPFLVPQADAELFVPAAVGDYTDFYASVHHAMNVGRMMRPDNPLLPNYKHVPIGYHGRASSLVISGTPVRRPWGQTKPEGADAPVFGPSAAAGLRARGRRVHRPGQQPRRTGPDRRDREPPVRPLPRERLVGARHSGVGIPAARSVSREELRHDRVALGRDDGRPRAVPGGRRAPARLATRSRSPTWPATPTAGAVRSTWRSRCSSRAPGCARAALRRSALSASNLRDLYWTLGQMATHHASNGCNLRPGDLLASGTVSGPSKDARGCLLELTWRGAEPLTLPTGEVRRFLEDGDEVISPRVMPPARRRRDRLRRVPRGRAPGARARVGPRSRLTPRPPSGLACPLPPVPCPYFSSSFRPAFS